MPEAPRLYPCLQCRDADAMMRWLCDVLGFRERVAYRDRQGIIHHAELALGSSILMLGQARDDEDGRRVGRRRRAAPTGSTSPWTMPMRCMRR